MKEEKLTIEDLPFDQPPILINEKGIKWRLDKTSTKYADSKGFKNVIVYFTEKPNGHRTRVITRGPEIEFESQKMEDIAVHIDIMKMQERP